MLSELGFQLYDEVIDYSFDSELDINLRAEKFIKNVINITKLDKQSTYNLLKPKLLYNYNRAIEIIKSKDLIPQLVKERLEEVKLKGHTLLIDSRFEMFMNNCND
jgi:flagellar assembly factor FliW